MQWARRHRRDSATVRSIGSTRNCRHARHKQAAVRYYCKAGCDRSASGLCRTYILSNMAADVALDSLHVVVAADVAYRVSFALRESLRISRAERADHERQGVRVCIAVSSCACELASTKYSTWYGKARRKVLEGSLVLFPERRNTLQLEMG